MPTEQLTARYAEAITRVAHARKAWEEVKADQVRLSELAGRTHEAMMQAEDALAQVQLDAIRAVQAGGTL